MPPPSRIQLKPFDQAEVIHKMGVTCKINDEEFDMLFDTGTSHPLISPN